jgi:DNA modification methylase
MANKDIEDKIIVLGKTFSSEEERRSYFREELRKKLPELKKIEGFPIGEDEDILNLSDPPFYTACPNPWINDFIKEWDEEKNELKKQKKRVSDFEVNQPYAADVSEGKYHPIYKFHPFPTKVPHLAIMRYILHYTEPGDIIYDGFSGTGMTGVASLLCGNPDQGFKHSINLENDKIGWGSRRSINSDLSPLAAFISATYNLPLKNTNITTDALKIINELEKEFGYLYETKDDRGRTGKINYTVWSDVFNCFHCAKEIVFWDSAVDELNGKVKDVFNCPHCNGENNKSNLERITESIFDTITKEVYLRPKMIPVIINYSINKKRYKKKPDLEDFEKLNRLDNEESKYWVPSFNYMNKGDNWGDTWRKGIHNGISKTHHFYFRRTLEVLSGLNSKTYGSPNQILLTKIAFQLTKLYRYTYQSGTWGAGGGPLSGTLYFPSLVKELNPITSIKNTLIARSKVKIAKEYGSAINGVQSASSLSNIESNSIDYIFTDPPFGSNLMYSELNFLTEAWLKLFTNNANEAIENKSQLKGKIEYQQLMTRCFSEFYRIIKPGKWMTVEFSNTSAAIWNGIQTSLIKSGFVIANVSALDKMKKSFKAVNTPTAVNQDLVISCYKPSSKFDLKFKEHQYIDVAIWDFIEEHLNHLSIHLIKDNATTAIIERSPKILYDRLISFYIQRGLPVPVDAGKFQLGLRERFIERDGMFFTNEQVQEYDTKKAAVPNFTQLSIFVANEQDSIYWLRSILEKNRKSESDLHPFWMKEVAGNMRKGDTLPEMRTILEENFLKDENGKWYVPDTENEADLEKLRNKRLLKQFDVYKTEAVNPRSKIKECRVEALRVGFKQCYQDKDFRTIVTIGDSIPNNLLMEDEVLLQFYDIANSRI